MAVKKAKPKERFSVIIISEAVQPVKSFEKKFE
jgi:hypothetical protein